MQDRERRDQADLLQAAVSDPILLFTNPEAFRKYAEERDRLRQDEENDNVDTRTHFERIHEEEMAKRVLNPPLLLDEYIASFHAKQNSRRGPTIGVDTDVAIQSKAELALLTPLRRTGPPEVVKTPEELKTWQ